MNSVRHQQALSLVNAICLAIGTLVVIQLWLFAVTVEGVLSKDASAGVPASIASFAVFACTWALFSYVRRLDKRMHPTATEER